MDLIIEQGEINNGGIVLSLFPPRPPALACGIQAGK